MKYSIEIPSSFSSACCLPAANLLETCAPLYERGSLVDFFEKSGRPSVLYFSCMSCAMYCSDIVHIEPNWDLIWYTSLRLRACFSQISLISSLRSILP